MARTLGSEDLDQVSHAGRRILIGWTGGGDPAILHNLGSAQSLPRELSLAPDRSLRQRFVPELQTLRTSEVRASGRDAWFPRFVGLQAEVCATLPVGRWARRAHRVTGWRADRGLDRGVAPLLPGARVSCDYLKNSEEQDVPSLVPGGRPLVVSPATALATPPATPRTSARGAQGCPRRSYTLLQTST